ncbi:RIIa domain-containing protein 1 [Aulostomus maculatus]
MAEEQGAPGKLDVTELSAEQQEKLRQFKIKMRIDNQKYLRSHPEVEVMVGHFLRNVILKRPDDVLEFAAEHFTNPNLQLVIGSKMEGNTDME